MPNCAPCDKYRCEKLAEKIVDPDEIVKRHAGAVPQEDFDRFVKPYDGGTRLDTVRQDSGKSD